jgi:hypothetical protein
MWLEIDSDCLADQHVLLHRATTTQISSYVTYQSYWQSQHECGTCVMLLRAVRGVYSITYHGLWMGRGGPTAWPPNSPDLNPLDFYLLGHLQTLAYALPLDHEGKLHHRIVDAWQIRLKYHSILSGRDVWRHALNLMEDILSTCYKRTLSIITHKFNVPGHIFIRTFPCFCM